MEKSLPIGYPAEHIELLQLKSGGKVLLRPVLPSDAKLLVGFFEKLSTRTRYLRFLHRLTSPSEEMLNKFVHLNYVADFAMVALTYVEERAEVIAISRYSLDRQKATADLAVTVRDDWQRLGLGRLLLEKVIDVGKQQGIGQFTGVMDVQNDIMKKILHDLGYQLSYFFRDGAFLVNIST